MNFRYPIILASNSPRRKELLESAGISFSVKTLPVEEIYPDQVPSEKVAAYLAEKKIKTYHEWFDNNIVICADTTVVLEGKVLEKPSDFKEAKEMLQSLSGKSHQVITGVAIAGPDKVEVFDESTIVHFRNLNSSEIEYYIETFHPYDKAGAYGIQEWIGMVGIDRIEGSYFNVVGLPVNQVYGYLQTYK